MIITKKNRIKGFGQTGVTGQDVTRYGPQIKGIPEESRDPINCEDKRKLEKIERILTRERDSNLEIYKRSFELVELKKTLLGYSFETMDYWESIGWELIYFPRINISEEKFFHDLEIGDQKQSFRDQVIAGKILTPCGFDDYKIDTEALFLKGTAILVEKDPHDFSRKIFRNIRMEKKEGIRDSSDRWEEILKPVLAEKLRVDPSRVRLKRVIEKFVLQFYEKRLEREQEEQDIWEWCLECLDTPFTRIRSNSFQIDCGWYYDDRPDTSFYPLVEL
ncbi:MAG: hypothetical protein E4H47_00350 [Parcubacteria group bacterium]|nr:MAG: hypothetical protein E4H47_00350 [Parcubacteria group bacterium]